MELQTFKYENMENLTTIEIDGEIWFVANEVCKVLGLGNSRQAISGLDDDEKNTVRLSDGIRGNPNKTIILKIGIRLHWSIYLSYWKANLKPSNNYYLLRFLFCFFIKI